MTDIELNKCLYEIMGLCFHIRSTNQCIKCHKVLIKAIGKGKFECLPANIDFLTWEGFGVLKEFMEKHKRWEEFIVMKLHGFIGDGFRPSLIKPHIMIPVIFIDPRALAGAVIEFFKENKP